MEWNYVGADSCLIGVDTLPWHVRTPSPFRMAPRFGLERPWRVVVVIGRLSQHPPMCTVFCVLALLYSNKAKHGGQIPTCASFRLKETIGWRKFVNRFHACYHGGDKQSTRGTNYFTYRPLHYYCTCTVASRCIVAIVTRLLLSENERTHPSSKKEGTPSMAEIPIRQRGKNSRSAKSVGATSQGKRVFSLKSEGGGKSILQPTHWKEKQKQKHN